jgi:benzoyl-CoA reductase/2-hydroxyglutaryl-CoA dehydratase subunit BcrC/BadD/HgdB
MIEIPREEIERSRELAELVERYNKLEELYREVRRLFKKDKTIVNYLDGSIIKIRQIMKFRDRLKPQEIRKLKEEINKSIEDFNRIKEGRKITPAEAKRRLTKGAEILKNIFSSLGLWGLAVGWFLPLYLITKMYSQIEKGTFWGDKK